MKYIIYPLGNPGKQYESTRHNAGRILIDKLETDKTWRDFLKQNDIYIFKDDKCYMNESGKALKKFLKGKKFNLERLIVIYDDKDFPLGKVRLAINKNAGGHNGLKNIIEEFQSKDFYRIRVGIAKVGTGEDGLIPPHGIAVKDFVLKNFLKSELKILESKEVIDKVNFLLKEVILK